MQGHCQIMQSTCTAKLEETSEVLGRCVSNLHLPSPSGAKELKVDTQGLAIESNSIKQLLNELNRLNKQRLSFLELNTDATSKELLQKKVNFLQSCVNDLTEQNHMLVQTIGHLQWEDGCKASNSEMKPCTSDHMMDVYDSDLRSLPVAPAASITSKPLFPTSLSGQEEDMSLFLHIDFPSTGSMVQVGSDSEDLEIQLQTSECILNNISKTLDQTRTSQNTDRQQRQKIQEQLHNASKEVERLQQEQTHIRHFTEKKLLRRKESLAKLHDEKDELRAKTEDQSRECVHLNQIKEKLEAELALCREKLHTSHLEVRSRDQFIIQLRSEMKTDEQKHQETQKQVTALEEEVRNLNCKVNAHEEKAHQLSEKVKCLRNQKDKEQQQLHDRLFVSQEQVEASGEKVKKQKTEMDLLCQQLKRANDEVKEASLKNKEQKETIAIFKQKYTTAIDKLHKVQRQVELLEEELRYSQEKLKESQLATQLVKEDLAELEPQYQFKVSQWESSQEVLDQLMDDLQANQNELRESQQKVDLFKSLAGSLQEQIDKLKQQKLMVEGDLCVYKQSHSHSDEDYLCLSRLKEQLQKVNMMLLKQAEEHLKEAKQESVRRSKEVNIQRGEVQRLQEELQLDKDKMRSAIRENQSLRTHSRQLRKELDQLYSKHQVAVEELAAHAGEARRMEGCLNDGKQAEGKMRSVAVRLQKEMAELRDNLQQAVDHKLKAEREKETAQELVKTVRSELEKTQSDNANLRYESQLVMTNVNLWITEQKASSESLAAQMKVQDKLLLIITEEKEQLQVANDMLKAEVKRLKEVADEKERDTERFKAQIGDRGTRQDGKTTEKKSRVARNLNKIEDMHSRLQSNLEAIGVLYQQLNVVSRENKWLRRQLEEERSMRGQVQQQISLPSTSQHSSSIHLPLSLNTRPPPISTSSASSHGLHHPAIVESVTGDTVGIVTQAEPSGSVVDRSGESKALG
ncbi:median body protein-like isoform X2 [Melanotaenia boesemani]|uniref:median body protein-like isoform X2 n=1 Tax=Melanotaenia boesemani TaxID=1250792 RepID=UPI001C04F67D|nr:median body protein-like isoform X2 [Melanotaenia boesemani]